MRCPHTSNFRAVAVVVLALTAFVVPRLSWAHHGWEWATDEEFEITGRIVGRSYNLYPDRES